MGGAVTEGAACRVWAPCVGAIFWGFMKVQSGFWEQPQGAWLMMASGYKYATGPLARWASHANHTVYRV